MTKSRKNGGYVALIAVVFSAVAIAAFSSRIFAALAYFAESQRTSRAAEQATARAYSCLMVAARRAVSDPLYAVASAVDVSVPVPCAILKVMEISHLVRHIESRGSYDTQGRVYRADVHIGWPDIYIEHISLSRQ